MQNDSLFTPHQSTSEFIYVDFETTGLPFQSSLEIITGFFKCGDDELEIKSFPYKWSEEAAKIHKISYNQAVQWPRMNEIFPNIHNWLNKHKEKTICFYARPNKGVLFDRAVLQLTYAVYSRVQNLDNLNFKWKNIYEDVKRLDFKEASQVSVYKTLFNSEYDAHDCKNDVMALIKIHNELLKRINLKGDNNVHFF